MIDVNTHEAKTQLSRLIAAVETTHARVRICRNGKPVALLISVDEVKTDPMKRHTELRGVRFHESPTAPLHESDWPTELR